MNKMMNNNQNNTKKTVFQYTVTANSDINYNAGQKAENKRLIKKISSRPSLERAMKALKLVNPFKGV